MRYQGEMRLRGREEVTMRANDSRERWWDEMKVKFDRTEMTAFFDRFAPLSDPCQLIEQLYEDDLDGRRAA